MAARPDHFAKGDPCARCGRRKAVHPKPKRKKPTKKALALVARKQATLERAREHAHLHETRERALVRPSPPRAAIIPVDRGLLAIDGEGYTTPDGRHLYCYMAAATEDRVVSTVENEHGLTTKQIFDFLFNLPPDLTKIGFSLGYDITKWIEDLDTESIYKILRPDERLDERGRPRDQRVVLRDYPEMSVNLVSTRLTLKRGLIVEHGPSIEGAQARRHQRFAEKVTVWDFFKFFGRSFVATLKDWKVCDQKEIDEIAAMKELRGEFDGISEREKLYCQSECLKLAKLGNLLLGACLDAGIPLTSFYGPGSIAGAMLKRDKAKGERPEIPSAMKDAVDRAFFGGRFETSRSGPIASAENDDIASAYPYAEATLPCLKPDCGSWDLVSGTHEELVRAVRGARAALVHYDLPPWEGLDITDLDDDDFVGRGDPPRIRRKAYCTTRAWGPFPFRLRDGGTVYPITSSGGWIWRPEILAVLDYPKLWPNLRLREAWIYHSKCKCPRPFFASVTKDYRYRLQWNKDGQGMVVKLGLNSRYGKRAQSVGDAPYKCLATAGMITSNCRAQLLRAIAHAHDPWSVLSVATDGILYDTPPKTLPDPVDTETLEAANEATIRDKKKRYPLGAWDRTDYKKGVFLIRPGMRFNLDLESEEGSTAARGIGVRVLHKNRKRILTRWKKAPEASLTVQQKSMFHGAKSCTTKRVRRGRTHYERHPNYGLWLKPEPHKISYSPLPKRPLVGPGHRLYTWCLLEEDGESYPYDRTAARLAPAVIELERMQTLASEQPDGGGVPDPVRD